MIISNSLIKKTKTMKNKKNDNWYTNESITSYMDTCVYTSQ